MSPRAYRAAMRIRHAVLRFGTECSGILVRLRRENSIVTLGICALAVSAQLFSLTMAVAQPSVAATPRELPAVRAVSVLPTDVGSFIFKDEVHGDMPAGA